MLRRRPRSAGRRDLVQRVIAGASAEDDKIDDARCALAVFDFIRHAVQARQQGGHRGRAACPIRRRSSLGRSRRRWLGMGMSQAAVIAREDALGASGGLAMLLRRVLRFRMRLCCARILVRALPKHNMPARLQCGRKLAGNKRPRGTARWRPYRSYGSNSETPAFAQNLDLPRSLPQRKCSWQ